MPEAVRLIGYLKIGYSSHSDKKWKPDESCHALLTADPRPKVVGFAFPLR
jgi:hypothetical protein